MKWKNILKIIVFFVIGLSLCACGTSMLSQQKTSYKPRSNHQKRPHHYAHDKRPTSGNLWEHVRNNFNFPDYSELPEVQAQISWYMRHQNHLVTVANRASPYMYYIFDQAKQHNLPAELVLLPSIESAFNPFAKSYAGASGLWQMMPFTATKFGVKQNNWYDGRRDVLNSTQGALNYLDYLCEFFNHDWLLALAAYDSGEGTVLNAIKRNIHEGKDIDFWSLRLPAETKAYVPRLLAVASIMKNPARYGVDLPFLKDEPYLTSVTINKPIKLATAAKMTGLSAQHLSALNPGCNKATIHPAGNNQLILPLDKVDLFQQNFSHYTTASVFMETRAHQHQVKKGDTLALIARHYKVNIKKLRLINHLRSDKVRKGQILTIPGKKAVADDLDLPEDNIAIIKSKKQARTNGCTYYTIKAGDTPWAIAQHFHVDAKKLLRWNKLADSRALLPGNKLTIYR